MSLTFIVCWPVHRDKGEPSKWERTCIRRWLPRESKLFQLSLSNKRERERRRKGGGGDTASLFLPCPNVFLHFSFSVMMMMVASILYLALPFFFVFNFPCKRRTFPPRSYGRILAPFPAFIWSAQTKTRFSTSSDLLTFPFFVCQSKRLTSQFLVLSSAFHIKVEHCVVCVPCFSFFLFIKSGPLYCRTHFLIDL